MGETFADVFTGALGPVLIAGICVYLFICIIDIRNTLEKILENLNNRDRREREEAERQRRDRGGRHEH